MKYLALILVLICSPACGQDLFGLPPIVEETKVTIRPRLFGLGTIQTTKVVQKTSPVVVQPQVNWSYTAQPVAQPMAFPPLPVAVVSQPIVRRRRLRPVYQKQCNGRSCQWVIVGYE